MGGKNSKSKAKKANSNSSAALPATAAQLSTPRNELKILLLGSGESGKTTFFKQVLMLYNNGYKSEELLQFKISIYANVLTTMKLLCESLFEQQQQHQQENSQRQKTVLFDNETNEKMAKSLLDTLESQANSIVLHADRIYDEKVSEIVEKLWKDSRVRQMFEDHASDLHIFDGAIHFMSDLLRLRPPSYIPTSEDVLYCRRKTTGVVEFKFTHDQYMYNLIDVGGQRNERRKWADCLSKLNAVIFVVSLSEYDQKCYEDDATNRMQESLQVFEETINGQMLRDTLIILLLNKMDLFEQKFTQKKNFEKFFPDYDSPMDMGGELTPVQHACQYIEDMYLEKNKFDPDRVVTHFTCAIQAESVQKTMDQIKSNVAQYHLGQSNRAL